MVAEDILDPKGYLSEERRPAIYFATSVLIDYWMSEGMGAESQPSGIQGRSLHTAVIRDLLRANRRVSGMLKVRQALWGHDAVPCVVTSPLALLELIEWPVASAFRNLAVDAIGANAIQRMGVKDLGNYLSRILEEGRSETSDQVGPARDKSTGLEILMSELLIERSFAVSNGLRGVIVPDIVHFRFSEDEAWNASEVLAYLQVGMADIMHVLVARHLGCSWLASFDSDFVRCRRQLLDHFGLTLLTSPDEIYSALMT